MTDQGSTPAPPPSSSAPPSASAVSTPSPLWLRVLTAVGGPAAISAGWIFGAGAPLKLGANVEIPVSTQALVAIVLCVVPTESLTALGGRFLPWGRNGR